MQSEFNLTLERASAAIGMLDSIKGSICWIAFIESDVDDTIRVRVRSRFMPTITLAEQFGGGGHAYASGASLNFSSEVNDLLAAADTMVKNYKENHEGWI